MLTEIGSLVLLLRGLLEANKKGTELHVQPRAEAIQRLQERLEGIAEQLEQSVLLSRLLPVWLKDFNAVDFLKDQLTGEDVHLLESRLRPLIHDSVRGPMAETFFRVPFSALPGIETAIASFRIEVRQLYQQLDAIPPGDEAAWHRAWTSVRVRMTGLWKWATKLNNFADQLHSELTRELAEAAKARG